MKINLIHDPQIEKAVLWYMLQPEINLKIIPEAIRIFKTANPFFVKLYRQAYQGILEIYHAEMAVNIDTLDAYFFSINDVFLTPAEYEMLEDKDKWQQFLINDPNENIEKYIFEFGSLADKLLDIYKRREMQRFGIKIQAYNGTTSDELAMEIHSKLDELNELSKQENVVDYGIGSLIKATLATLESVSVNDGLIGTSTGFADLDLYTSGIQKGELTIIAGRPSMGKSTFADILAYNIAKQGEKVAIISYEMGYMSIIHKLIASEANMDSNFLRNGWALKDEKLGKKLMDATENIHSSTEGNLYIIDNFTDDVDVLAEKMAYMADNDGVQIFFIDYMQKLFCNRIRKSGGNREQEISAISDVLQKLTRRKKVAIMALSQLSRGCDSRPDKRPMLSDLRESGSIEQDADVVMFLYRDAVYSGDKSDKSLEVIIAKQRNGATGTVFMYYELSTSRITPMVRT